MHSFLLAMEMVGCVALLISPRGNGSVSVAAIGIILAALSVQVSQPPATDITAGSADDIVVLGHRLKKVRWEFEAKNGALLKCAIKRSSGSTLVDLLLCKASAQCAAENPRSNDAELVPCIRGRVERLYAAR